MSDAAADTVLTTTSAGVLTITMNRPEKKNALTVAMYEGLVKAVKDGVADDGVRVLHIRGTQGSFTAGNDLMDFMNTPPAGMDSPVIQFLLALIDCEKPVVAEVSGPAVGIGVTMLLHCDLIYADETARFKMPFVDLGLCPEGASSLLLPRAMGFPQASELLLFSDRFDAEKAKRLGIITDVVASGELAAHVAERCATLAKKAPTSVRITKDLLRRTTKDAVKRAIEEEGNLFLERLKSAEAMEAFQAFFEKREPQFS